MALMVEAETAQAMELVRALCEKAREMSRRLAWLEREGAANRDAPREIARTALRHQPRAGSQLTGYSGST